MLVFKDKKGNRLNGWFETLRLEGKLCFTKSFTYNTFLRQYFQGFDPDEYFQYEFYIQDRDSRWLISVQGGERPTLDVTGWRYNVDEALRFFKVTIRSIVYIPSWHCSAPNS